MRRVVIWIYSMTELCFVKKYAEQKGHQNVFLETLKPSLLSDINSVIMLEGSTYHTVVKFALSWFQNPCDLHARSLPPNCQINTKSMNRWRVLGPRTRCYGFLSLRIIPSGQMLKVEVPKLCSTVFWPLMIGFSFGSIWFDFCFQRWLGRDLAIGFFTNGKTVLCWESLCVECWKTTSSWSNLLGNSGALLESLSHLFFCARSAKWLLSQVIDHLLDQNDWSFLVIPVLKNRNLFPWWVWILRR